MSRNKLLIDVLACLFLPAFVSSCAYPISQEYRREAKPGLTFAMVDKDPGAYKGDVVIWGGRIIRTVNTEKGAEIYVLETPLNYREKPMPAEYSEGRFIAETDSYIDPLVYHSGKMLTVAGVVAGSKKISGHKNKLTYTYPVIQIKELNLWKKRVHEPYYYPNYPYDEWGYGPYWSGYGGFGFEGGEGFEGDEGEQGFEGGGEGFEGGGEGENGGRGDGRE
jgi:outer membrane lipoprotein